MRGHALHMLQYSVLTKKLCNFFIFLLTFMNFFKSGEIDPSLFDLIRLFLALIPQSFAHAFICLARTLVLILLCGLRASSSEVGRTSTDETTVRLTRTIVLFAS